MSLEQELSTITKKLYGKTIKGCSNSQIYDAVLQLTKDRMDAVKSNTGKKN